MINLKNPTGQTARWLQEIETYDLSITHETSRKHSKADALSRRPCQELRNPQTESDSETSQITPYIQICAITRSEASKNIVTPESGIVLDRWQVDSIQQAQLNDKDISPIFVAKESNESRPAWNNVSPGSRSLTTICRIRNSSLYRRFITDDDEFGHLQFMVPSAFRNQLRYFHNIPTGGHLEAEKTLDKIKHTMYWPKMKRDIEKYCLQCDLCAAKKPSRAANQAPLRQYLVGEPMERVSVDILGPLTENGNRYILVICDCFSKWIDAFVIPDQASPTITRILVDEFICRYGTPLQLHSDQGRSFESKQEVL